MIQPNSKSSTVAAIRDDYMGLVRQRRLYGGLLLMVFAILLISGFLVADERNAGGFVDGFTHIFDFPEGVIEEAWEKRADMPKLLVRFVPSLVETVNIAAVSTLLGTIGGIFLSLIGTRGLALWPHAVPFVRRFMDILRALPEIVVALVLIFMLGGGPMPAVIAIGIHTSGTLGKLFSEVNENADLKPVVGLASVGANWSQRMWFGVVPQVAPNYMSYALLRFEINIRASAILGFVGSGGIGYDLKNAMTWGQGRFDEAAAIFILLFLTIVLVDQTSSRVRAHLTEGN